MPVIKLQHVCSSSSEDTNHPAENLLNLETYRKWKCAAAGEKQAVVILQFERATQIHSIDIGNDGSAFVEVMVGRSSSPDEYQVLLVASTFMTPVDSKAWTNTSRVRIFGKEKLSKNVAEQKWDRAKVVCTQPYNKTEKYGLAFIKFHSPPAEEESTERQPVKLGAFTLRDETKDLTPGSLFHKEHTKPSSIPAATAAAQARMATAAALKADQSDSSGRKMDQSDSSPKRARRRSPPTAVVTTPKYTMKKRASDSHSSGTPPAKRASDSHSSGTPPAKRASDSHSSGTPPAKRASDSHSSGTPPAKRASDSHSSGTPPAKRASDSHSSGTPPAKRASDSHSSGTPPAKRAKAAADDVDKRKEIPFDLIMNGVVFTLSGFKNPFRGELREKGVELGAKYEPDWSRSCTHLVCAFPNTPKFNQVKAKHGLIVKKEWILDSYVKKRRLPAKKYRLSGGGDSSSEDEFYDKKEAEITKKITKGSSTEKITSPKMTTSSTAAADTSSGDRVGVSRPESTDTLPLDDPYGGSTDEGSDMDTDVVVKKKPVHQTMDDSSECDTEDEIQRIKEQQNKEAGDPYGGSTEEESDKEVRSKALTDLSDFFSKCHFLIYGSFSPLDRRLLLRYITAYNGHVEDYMGDKVTHVISQDDWDSNFDQVLSENSSLAFVRPKWIFVCHQKQACMPCQPYIIVPN